MPCTCQSHTQGEASSTPVIGDENQVSFEHSIVTNQSMQSRVPARRVIPNPQANVLQPMNGKCTFAQVDNTGDAHASSSSAMQTNPLKRARTVGPIHSRPMPLIIPMASDSDEEDQKVPSKDGKTANQQGRDDSASKGKGKGKQVTAKLQCSHGDHTHPLVQLENGNHDFNGPKVDDDGYVTDTYLVDNDNSVDFSMKAPSKFLESLAIERPKWAASGSSKPAKSASQGSSSSSNHTDGCTTVDDGLDKVVAIAGPSGDVCFALDLIKDCLLNAANHLKPGSMEILNRLKNDQQYIMKLMPLPCARICLIHSEVKECCNIITMASFIALGQEPNVIEYVWAALANALSRLVMRSHPYCNECIINVIWDMYFTGGATSFSKTFDYLFPIFEGCEGEMYEVPVPRVALVATASDLHGLWLWVSGPWVQVGFSQPM
ncbi:hypothetical protein EI94DRAFT_1704454 [Lactarius quietus]|nr:hypothetical protein EI94DRAFT_1704454 [Lactarius quietus]